MSDEQLQILRGVRVEVITVRNEKVEGIVTNFQLAANHPNLICAICIKDRVLTLDAIKTIQIAH